MEPQQRAEFGALIDEWKATAAKHGMGVDEDTMNLPIEYPVRVTMHRYVKRGLFGVPDPSYAFYFANPHITTGVRLLQAKAHINRLIRSNEEPHLHTCHPQWTPIIEAAGEVAANDPLILNVWSYLDKAITQLREQQPGLEHDITMEAMTTHETESYANRFKQSQEIALAVGVAVTKDDPLITRYLMVKTPIHTVCPFILHETGGPSHTQRCYLQVEMWSKGEICISPLIREINTRLQPCQSLMKIPDEAVHVLRAYSAPTYTEDAVVRVLKILRGIKPELIKNDAPLRCKVFVQSIESIFSNDLTSEGEDEIE